MTPNGGPAFPVNDIDGGNLWFGLSIRDYIAAKMMQAIVTSDPTGVPPSEHEQIAKEAYMMADQMLKERAK